MLSNDDAVEHVVLDRGGILYSMPRFTHIIGPRKSRMPLNHASTSL